MTYLEATGAPLECARCGRPAPADDADRADWGGLMLNGRLVQLACPDCLTPAERGQVDDRRGASLWEVAAARRVDRATLANLAAAARARGSAAPSAGWVAQLVGGVEHIGLMTGEVDGGELICVWAGPTEDGRHVGTLFTLPIADWMALEEVYVPYSLQAWAKQLGAAAARPAG